MGRELSIPSAIVLGSAMIAAAVYFGLRQGSEARSPEERDRSLQLAPLPSVTAPRSVAPAPAPPIMPRDEVAKQVVQALEAHRPALVARCWKPSFAVQPEPPTIKYVLVFTFDAQGRQLARGLAEDRATARPDVTSCLTTSLPSLRIPAPGAGVQLDVPFSLP